MSPGQQGPEDVILDDTVTPSLIQPTYISSASMFLFLLNESAIHDKFFHFGQFHSTFYTKKLNISGYKVSYKLKSFTHVESLQTL